VPVIVLFAFNAVLLVAGILAARPRMLPPAESSPGEPSPAAEAPAPPPASPSAGEAS